MAVEDQWYENPLLQMGLGILAANRPGASFGEAVGGGMLSGIQSLSQIQERKRNAAARQVEAKLRQQELTARSKQLQQAEDRRKLQQAAATQAAESERFADAPNLAQLAAMSDDPLKGLAQVQEMTRGPQQKLPTGMMIGPDGKPTWIPGYLEGRGQVAARGATKIVNRTGQKFGESLGKGLAEDMFTRREKALGAANQLRTINEGRALLDSGIISGKFANVKLEFGKALRAAGIDYGGDEIANTESYMANAANNVAEIIKNFGAGTGLSDADREYAQKAAAGDITMTEQSMRRIFDISERAIQNVLRNYNRDAQQVQMSPYGQALPYSLVIEQPAAYQQPEAQSTGQLQLSPEAQAVYEKYR